MTQHTQKMYAVKFKDGRFKAVSSKHLMGYDTEAAVIPWEALQLWHTKIARLRQDKAELVAKGQALLTALDTDQYGKITDACIRELEATIAKHGKES